MAWKPINSNSLIWFAVNVTLVSLIREIYHGAFVPSTAILSLLLVERQCIVSKLQMRKLDEAFCLPFFKICDEFSKYYKTHTGRRLCFDVMFVDDELKDEIWLKDYTTGFQSVNPDTLYHSGLLKYNAVYTERMSETEVVLVVCPVEASLREFNALATAALMEALRHRKSP